MKTTIDPPLITTHIFDVIAEKEKTFSDFVAQYYRYICSLYSCEPTISEMRLSDAYRNYVEDKKRMLLNLPQGKEQPDHFELTGLLVFWLRRFAPVYDLGRPKTGAIERVSDTLRHNASQLCAFQLGLTICDTFENHGKDSDEMMAPDIKRDYYHYICYLMKCKSLSPHALAAIYKSLFIKLIPHPKAEENNKPMFPHYKQPE